MENKQIETAPSLSTSMDSLRAERDLLQEHISGLYEACKKLKKFNVTINLYVPIESEGYPIVSQLEREIINLHYMYNDLEKLLTHLRLTL